MVCVLRKLKEMKDNFTKNNSYNYKIHSVQGTGFDYTIRIMTQSVSYMKEEILFVGHTY